MPVDYTGQYNTTLNPNDEQAFQQWAQDNGKLRDLYDYDIRGLWSANRGALDNRGHGPDSYKKPNHPTFSNESMYSGGNAGVWTVNPDGSYAFTPGPENIWPSKALQEYFKQVEPGVNLWPNNKDK